MQHRNWLVFANRSKCHHTEALHDLGFINWKDGNVSMNIGDTVYLYMSDERRVRFKTEVIGTGCKREDEKYWQVSPSKDLTYKLKLIDEYNGQDLDEEKLREHGFKGGRSIETPMYNNAPLFQYIDSVFIKKDLTHLIDDIVPQKKSRELVKKMIPILVRWAKQGITTNTYDELIKELGYERYSGIGRQLGMIDDIFKRIEKLTGEKIPTLNALVKSKSTQLPSPGFSYVYKSYPEMSDDEKRHLVALLNNEAIRYPHWDWVLSVLSLAPSLNDTKASENAIRSGCFYGSGGEGENHKKLKEYIFNHPESLGLTKVFERKMEYNLLSGDRLDVLFVLPDDSRIAVEVKPSTSPDDDVMRGLYQCIKYKSILDAEDNVHGKKSSNGTILVLGGTLSPGNRIVRDILGITVKENFNI